MATITWRTPSDDDAAKRPAVEAWSSDRYREWGTLLAVVPESPHYLVWVDGLVKRHLHCRMQREAKQMMESK